MEYVSEWKWRDIKLEPKTCRNWPEGEVCVCVCVCEEEDVLGVGGVGV